MPWDNSVNKMAHIHAVVTDARIDFIVPASRNLEF